MQKHSTREQIHNGLSQKKEDEKWSDLLNFRSSDNRTFVVPRRFKMFECNAGFHTVLHGLNNECYAVGSNASVCFKSHDNTAFTRLWKVSVTNGAGTTVALQVRGGYTRDVAHTCGTDPEVHTINVGNFLKQSAGLGSGGNGWTPPPDEPENTVGCPLLLDGRTHIQVNSGSSPVSSAFVQVYDGRLLLFEGMTNALGALSIEAQRTVLRIRATKPNGIFNEVTLSPCAASATIEISPFIGLEFIARYSNLEGPVPGGHSCNAATYKLFGNTVEIGSVNLNNESDGGDREVILTVTAEQAQAMAVVNDNSIDFSLDCDPTHPDFDATYDGGACHTSLAWVIVKDNNGVELYNGAPVGGFLTLTF